MTWNWQEPDWPNFRWDAAALARAEQHFQASAGFLLLGTEQLTVEAFDELTVEALGSEAVTSSEIEGEI